MKSILSILVCVLAGLVGLALVFRDLPIPPGLGLIALGGVFYLLVGVGLAKLNRGRKRVLWAVAPAWGLGLLGLIGVWTSITDPPSGHWTLALLFLLGPAVAGLMGASLASRLRVARRFD